MDGSKQWSTTIALGQKILEELNLDRSVDTMGRWLAHYLAEKMELADSATEGEARTSAQRGCEDLIFRLWERRHAWPLSSPLKDVAERLDHLLKPTVHFLHESKLGTDPYMNTLHRLEELQQREKQICLIAWIAGLNLDKEREFLKNHSENLDNEELQITERLIDLQVQLSGPNAEIDGEKYPDFLILDKIEQLSVVTTQLQVIGQSRLELLQSLEVHKM